MMHTVIGNAGAGDPYPIDTLFMFMANMAWNSAMNPGETTRVLTEKRADGEYVIPHVIYSDAYFSETVPYADLILPDTTYLERWDCISILDRPIGSAHGAGDAIRQPVIKPDPAHVAGRREQQPDPPADGALQVRQRPAAGVGDGHLDRAVLGDPQRHRTEPAGQRVRQQRERGRLGRAGPQVGHRQPELRAERLGQLALVDRPQLDQDAAEPLAGAGADQHRLGHLGRGDAGLLDQQVTEQPPIPGRPVAGLRLDRRPGGAAESHLPSPLGCGPAAGTYRSIASSVLRSEDRARLCSWDTRASVTPSIRPISVSLSPR